jgi:hypothetical protein
MKVHFSNIGQDFHGFPQFLLGMLGWYLEGEREHFFPHTFQLITHQLSYPTIRRCTISDYDSVLKYVSGPEKNKWKTGRIKRLPIGRRRDISGDEGTMLWAGRIKAGSRSTTPLLYGTWGVILTEIKWLCLNLTIHLQEENDPALLCTSTLKRFIEHNFTFASWIRNFWTKSVKRISRNVTGRPI